MILPENIRKLVEGKQFTVDDIGLSDSAVICYGDMFLKIQRSDRESLQERTMMAWLAGRVPVPAILAYEHQEGFDYMLMSRVSGRMLCSEDILSDSDRLIGLMAEAYDMMRNVDIADCPVCASIDSKLALAEQRVAAGLCSTDDAEPETYGPGGFDSPEHLLHWLVDNRPEEHLQLTHGDFCLPNIFTDGHSISGFIDLGRSGTADGHIDLALGVRSLRHNLEGKYSDRVYPSVAPQRLFDLLDIRPDEELLRYYTLLDELF